MAAKNIATMKNANDQWRNIEQVNKYKDSLTELKSKIESNLISTES